MYRIIYEKRILKDLDKIPAQDVGRIVGVFRELSLEPFPPRCKKLSSKEKIYRVRQGNYRVIYAVDLAKHEIKIILVGHRKEIYRHIE